jgi:hypothetical protein
MNRRGNATRFWRDHTGGAFSGDSYVRKRFEQEARR